MKWQRIRPQVIWFLCIAALVGAGQILGHINWRRSLGRGPSIARVHEATLLAAAKFRVMPEFPPEALLRRQAGVAVAKLTLDPRGTVELVEVLEAPSQELALAVESALRLWNFDASRLVGPTNPTAITGKLTFYFSLERGGTVVDSSMASR